MSPLPEMWNSTAPATRGAPPGRADGYGVRAAPGVPGRARRRPALLAAGVALAAVGALAGVALVNSAGHREAVLVMARPVAVGSVVGDGDVAVAQVYVDPSVQRVPATDRASVAGRVATTDLTAGELLAPGQVADSAKVPRPGQVLTSVTVPASRVPAVGLQPGDVIRVVSTPADQGDPAAAAVSASGSPSGSGAGSIAATVVRVSGPDASSNVSIDVVVADVDGDGLAARAATGRIAIVLQPHPSSASH